MLWILHWPYSQMPVDQQGLWDLGQQWQCCTGTCAPTAWVTTWHPDKPLLDGVGAWIVPSWGGEMQQYCPLLGSMVAITVGYLSDKSCWWPVEQQLGSMWMSGWITKGNSAESLQLPWGHWGLQRKSCQSAQSRLLRMAMTPSVWLIQIAPVLLYS